MRINWQRLYALIAVLALCAWPMGCIREPLMDSTVPTPDGAVAPTIAALSPTALVAAAATDTVVAATATLPPASPSATLPPATATLTLTPTPIPSPTETVTPTAAATLPPSAPIRLVQAMDCPSAGVRIASLVVQDRTVEFSGTASMADFQYYKLEYQSVNESDWHFMGQVETPVEAGSLYTWDASMLPPGNYYVKLIVVDQTGNYPPPCQVEIKVLE